MAGSEIERLIQLLAKLPGLGPRSARRAVLHMLKRREALMLPTADAIRSVAQSILPCSVERTASYPGRYHVLGGILSALDGVRPEDLNIAGLVTRCASGEVREVILAMNATVDGQSTAHYLTDRLEGTAVKISRLAHGVPIGGELDYLDEGTLAAALKARRPF